MTSWTAACQAPLSMRFPKQEYWGGLLCPSPEDLPNPGIKSVSLALVGGFFTAEPPGAHKKSKCPQVGEIDCGISMPWDTLSLSLSVAKSCLTLCNPSDYSLPGSSIPGISQARILE